jgi:hypothetical protein
MVQVVEELWGVVHFGRFRVVLEQQPQEMVANLHLRRQSLIPELVIRE